MPILGDALYLIVIRIANYGMIVFYYKINLSLAADRPMHEFRFLASVHVFILYEFHIHTVTVFNY